MCPNSQFSAYLVTITEEILNGKLHFLCNELPEFNFCVKCLFKPQILKALY